MINLIIWVAVMGALLFNLDLEDIPLFRFRVTLYFGHSVQFGNGIINSSAFDKPILTDLRRFSNNSALLNLSSKNDGLKTRGDNNYWYNLPITEVKK